MIKTVETIRRTGNAQSAVRFLVAVSGEGKNQTRQVMLATPIYKVGTKEQFRHGGKHVPIEQYGFRVSGITYVRFADAAAAVLFAEELRLTAPDASDVQIYVRKAHKILNGQDKYQVLDQAVADTYGPMAA